jgi:hypothetical protein
MQAPLRWLRSICLTMTVTGESMSRHAPTGDY